MNDRVWPRSPLFYKLTTMYSSFVLTAGIVAQRNLEIEHLKIQLAKIEKELAKVRTSVMDDGWQTQRHAKKARKWDILAQKKMEILRKIDELNNRPDLQQFTKNFFNL